MVFQPAKQKLIEQARAANKPVPPGGATASSNEGNNNSGGGLLGVLLSAAITQISDSATDKAYDIAKIANVRLFTAGTDGELLYGPRSPKYGQSVQ